MLNSPFKSYWKNDGFGTLAIYEDASNNSFSSRSKLLVEERKNNAIQFSDLKRGVTLKPTPSASIIINRSPVEKVFYQPMNGHPGDVNLKNDIDTPKNVKIFSEEKFNQDEKTHEKFNNRLSYSKTENIRNPIFDDDFRSEKVRNTWMQPIEPVFPFTPSRSNKPGNPIYDMKKMEEDARHAKQLKAAQELMTTVKKTFPTERSPDSHQKSIDNLEGENQYWKDIPYKLRETMIALLGSKRKGKIDIEPLIKAEKRDSKWYENIEKRAYSLKDKLRQESRLINHIIERRSKFLKEFDVNKKALNLELEQLMLNQNVKRKKDFERDVKYNIEGLKKNLDESVDLKNELEILIIIFKTSEVSDFSFEGGRGAQSIDREFDFDGFSLRLYKDYQNCLEKFEVAMSEYKSFFKLDYQSEEFNKRTMNLLKYLSELQQFLKETSKHFEKMLNELVWQFGVHENELEQMINFYKSIFTNLEDSYDLVNKLLYIKRSQLNELKVNLMKCEKDLSEIQYPFSIEANLLKNKMSLEKTREKLIYLKRALTLRKTEVKRLREDSRTQYFVFLRLKVGNKILTDLKGLKCQLGNLFVLLKYFNERSIIEERDMEEFSHAIAKFSEECNSRLKTESINNTVLRDLREKYLNSNKVLGEIINMRSTVSSRAQLESFKPIEKALCRIIEHLNRYESQILEIQMDILPFMQYDLSEYDNVVVEANQILQDCEKYRTKLRENEYLFYDFEDKEGNVNEINRIQQGLMKNFRSLEILKKRLTLDKIAKELASLHKQVAGEKANFAALKLIFDNNAYFTAENYHNIKFDESENSLGNESTFFQLADMKSDINRDFEKSIQKDKFILPEIKACALHIRHLAVFTMELLKKWGNFDKELHSVSHDKSQIAKFREILEEIHTITGKNISDFKKEEPERFDVFMNILIERLKIYYEETHKYIDKNSSIDVDKIFRELDLRKNHILTRDYVLELDELYKYIKRHPDDIQQEKMDILLGSIAENLKEESSVEKILTWDVESQDVTIIVVLESIMKNDEDLAKFLLASIENHRMFTTLVAIYKNGQNPPWNATFIFEDYQFLEYFRNFTNFFLSESHESQKEIRGKIAGIADNSFKKLIEGRLSECINNYKVFLDKFSINNNDNQMRFLLRLLEISFDFKINYETLYKEVYAGVSLGADKFRERLNKLNDLFLMFDTSNQYLSNLFDRNESSQNSDIEQLRNPLYIFVYVKNYSLIRTIRKDYGIENWLRLLSAFSAWLKQKGDYFKKQKNSKIITDHELDNQVQNNEEMRRLYVEFAKFFKEN